MAVKNEIIGRRGSGRTHAKVIVLGEHAVVYGNPAIAFPVRSLELHASAVIEGSAWQIETPFHQGHVRTDALPTDDLERLLAVTAVRNTLEFLGQQPEGLRVIVSGYIPPARGLGSSAAVAGAIARAIAGAYSAPLSREDLFELVQSVERVAHGTPSGLDAYATTESGPVWFEQGTARPLTVPEHPRLVIADTGITGRTSQAVAQVRKRYESNTAGVGELLAETAVLTHGARSDLASGDFAALGSKMNRNHEILQSLGVSAPSLDTLVNAAHQAGALGAKLTGGGLGGCMVALVPDAESEAAITEALTRAGARDVWSLQDTKVRDE